VWFLEQARARQLLPALRLDVPGQFSEVSAGGAVVRVHDGRRELLVIRTRAEGYELPKGAIEWDELPADAAVREIREEAGIDAPLEVGIELGAVDYTVGEGADEHTKRVRYFLVSAPAAPLLLAPLPSRTRERRWLALAEAATVPLVNESLRPLLRSALEAQAGN